MQSFLIIRRQGCSGLRVISSRTGASSLQWKTQRHGNAWISLARQHHVSAIVVGGGPAGIAVVGSLLNQIKPGTGEGQGKIAWIDQSFKGGRINRKYREVPSNTKAGLFFQYANVLGSFRAICKAAPKPNAITALRRLPQEETCSLAYAGDMLQLLTDGLVKHERIDSTLGRVNDLKWDESTKTWSLNIKDFSVAEGVDSEVQRTAPLVVYCTGSSPKTIALPVTEPPEGPKPLDLDLALHPTNLERYLCKVAATKEGDQPLTIGVIGASHSAILVLMNLVDLQAKAAATDSPLKNLRVKWFTRTPKLKYAVYKEDYILYDNTGLKGRCAQFAREQLEGKRLKKSKAGKIITRVSCSGGETAELEAFVKELPGVDHVVQAVGYTRDPLPEIVGGGGNAIAGREDLVYNHETGEFQDRNGKVVKGLFGAGIAFPERTIDPEGNVEYAVGFWKFMKYLKKVVPEWVNKTKVRSD